MAEMIHAKTVKPRIFPWNNDCTPAQIDRAQTLGGDLTLGQEKQYEINRDGKLGVKKNTPGCTVALRQFEYGSIAFWRKLANKEDPLSAALDESVTLEDLKTSKFDIAAYLTDDNSDFRGTIWFPKLRVNGFSLNIADPDAIIERNFDLVGEDYKILDGKYFSFQQETASGATVNMVLSPVPIEYASEEYIYRVLRVRSGVVTELEKTTDWTYTSGTHTLAVTGCSIGDIIKAYYPSDTAYTTLWTDNDVDVDFLTASYCEIRLKVGTGTRIYRLQSVGLDAAFDRADYKEIGNSEIVLTGVNNKTITISLDRYSTDFALEDILASDTTYPYIDPRDFADNIQLQVKVYNDKEHSVFKIGWLVTGLSPTALSSAQEVETYNKRTNTLESDNFKISCDETEIEFL